MEKLSFTLNGIITKHSTEVKKGLIFKRMNVKCSDTVEVNGILSALSSWGKISDPISGITVIHNVDDDPYTKRVFNLDEYCICMELVVCGEATPVQFKSISISRKYRTVKTFDGDKKKEAYLEANLTFEKRPLPVDDRFNELYLKHTEPSDNGKEVIVPLELNFDQIDHFSLFDMPQSNDEQDDDDDEPQVFQTV